jgi:hypothetical protein
MTGKCLWRMSGAGTSGWPPRAGSSPTVCSQQDVEKELEKFFPFYREHPDMVFNLEPWLPS